MKKYLIITTALTTICFAPEIMAQCTENTDCASLGYTETSCPDGGLKCPLGNYWYCPGEQCSDDYKYTCSGSHETGGSGEACDGKYKSCTCADGYEWKNGTCQEILKPEWGKCNGSAKNCNIGDILYSDGTCSSQNISGKTPIAVVVYKSDDSNCGQAMALNSIGRYIWGAYDIDVPDLTNFATKEEAATDFQSYKNTAVIIAIGDKNYQAAWAAYEYQTEGTSPGNWCLPAAGIMTSIYDNISTVNNRIDLIGGSRIEKNSYYWTSSERNKSYAWISDFALDYGLINFNYAYDGKNDTLYEVRPVIEF